MTQVHIGLISGDTMEGYIDIPEGMGFFEFIDKHGSVILFNSNYEDSGYIEIRSSAIIAVTEIFD